MVLYYTTKYDFPVTNHLKNITEDNIGWIRGVMSDELPFEAEIWRKADEVDVAFIIPAIYSEYDKINPYDTVENERIAKESKAKGITYYTNQAEMWDGGILAIGMVDEGYEEDIFVTQNYVEILENNELIEFTTDLYNGTVQYVTDVNGNEFARVVITLEDSDNCYATCPLLFEEFKVNNSKKKFKVIK